MPKTAILCGIIAGAIYYAFGSPEGALLAAILAALSFEIGQYRQLRVMQQTIDETVSQQRARREAQDRAGQ